MTCRSMLKFGRYENKAILKSAEGQICTMHSPACNHDPRTTVWCHSNQQRHGKGKGIKAHDIFGFYGCSGCHDWYDRSDAPREEKDAYFQLAFEKSLLMLVRGVL